MFNYKEIESIPLREIKAVVIGPGKLLRKITSDREIIISNGKLLM